MCGEDLSILSNDVGPASSVYQVPWNQCRHWLVSWLVTVFLKSVSLAFLLFICIFREISGSCISFLRVSYFSENLPKIDKNDMKLAKKALKMDRNVSQN